MMAWRAGDPVGCGKVYLPDQETRSAYGAACRAAVIDAAARRALTLPTVEARRKFIAAYPAREQPALKARMSQLWRKE